VAKRLLNQPKLRAAIAALGLPPDAAAKARAAWGKDWARSGRAYKPGRVAFLAPAAVRGLCRRVKMPADAAVALLQAARGVASSPALERIAWHCHWMLVRSGTPQLGAAYRWPILGEKFGEPGRLVYALVCLSALPRLEKINARRGVPPRITRDTMADVEVWMRDYLARHGRWGFDRQGWLMLHCHARNFRLGRLQFEPAVFKQSIAVYRHARTGEAVALAGHGSRFDHGGRFTSAKAPTAGGGWRATLTRRGQTIRGYPISPLGFALRQAVELDARQWKPALKKGDPVLYVHVPAMGPMDFDACGKSFAAAMRFFPRHFPKHKFKAFCSGSWLFDDQLGDHLPAESNIVRFQREFYLLPLEEASDFQTWERVFGSKPEDLARAPRDTALRRAILDHALKGGRWRAAGMVLLRGDLDWGKQVYRRNENRGAD
jgi:hypothetical protein